MASPAEPDLTPTDDPAELSLKGASAAGIDPLSLMPLPDPSASGFTIDQVWPRQAIESTPNQGQKARPDWLVGISVKPMS
jgi:hypothetical protein